MYKSIEQIKKLREDKQAILKNVYQSNDPDEVYKNQSALGSMSITIFTDAANAVMPALHSDGVSNVVWPNISMKLSKLSFVSVPTVSEIHEKYRQSTANPTAVGNDGAQPKPGKKTKLPTLAFLALMPAQGVAVPLLLSLTDGNKLGKALTIAANTALIAFEVANHFDWLPNKNKKATSAHAATEDYEAMYRSAIQEVYSNNRKKLDDWFDNLEKVATEEIEKAIGKAEV